MTVIVGESEKRIYRIEVIGKRFTIYKLLPAINYGFDEFQSFPAIKRGKSARIIALYFYLLCVIVFNTLYQINVISSAATRTAILLKKFFLSCNRF